VLVFIVLLVIEYLVVPELVGASKDLYLLGRINAAWVIAGTALEGASLFCYAVLTRVLLPPGRKPSLSRLFRIDLSAAAVAHVIPAGTLGTAALGYRLFTAEGISGNDATVMMAAKGIGSTVVLNVLLWLSLVISIPLAGFRPIYGTVAIIGTIVLLGAGTLILGVTRGAGFASRVLRVAGDKIPGLSGERVERAIVDASQSFALLARDKRVMAWSLLWASLNWLLDAASLWCFVAAFGSRVNPVELFAAYGISNVAGALPLTPGGLGVVDSVTPLLLVGFGVTRSVATLGVLGWRMVNFWLPIPTGAASYVSLKVKPHSGMRAVRSAISSLLAGGGPADADEDDLTEDSAPLFTGGFTGGLVLMLSLQPSEHRQRREVGPGQGDAADTDVDRDPALPGPVDVLQVQQQGELVDDEGQAGAVADGDPRVAAMPLLAADGDRADRGQHGDAPHVVMQVLAADADIAEGSPASPDAVGQRPQPGKGSGESQPAEQGGFLPGTEFLLVGAVDGAGRWHEVLHVRPVPPAGARNPPA
jgi:uncharacterized protein (TIRG00374 family)